MTKTVSPEDPFSKLGNTDIPESDFFAQNQDDYFFQIIEGRLLHLHKKEEYTLERMIEVLAFVEDLRQKKQDRQARKEYATKLFQFLKNWMVFVGIVVVMTCLNGDHIPWTKQWREVFGFTLPKEVLITLLGTTTLNVIGLFLVVANYLFPKSKETKKISDTEEVFFKSESSKVDTKDH